MERVIKLKFPFQFEGKTIEEIKVRPAKIKEVKDAESKFPKDSLERNIYLLSKISGVAIEAIEEMAEPDYVKILEEYNSFFQ